jgi:tRNA modification GTPase
MYACAAPGERSGQPATLDTIAAIATPPGRGAIAIVRASGPEVVPIAARVFRTALPLAARVATVGSVLAPDGSTIDQGLGLYFRAPYSATGEDVLELHVHGSTAVARDTLLALVAAGARPAEPGEFTRRAFLAGKLDLSAAEAVGELIDAERTSVARAALGRLAGGLARAVEEERAQLGSLLEELAAALDFPDEVETPPARDVAARLDAIDAKLAALEATWESGRIVREGVSVAIVGPPNAGKSSLLNALLGSDRALVSEIAGTTRDTIEESLALDSGVVARLIDTAGVRTAGDRLEAAGIARTERALAEATIALVVVDGSRALGTEALDLLERTRSRPRVVYFNKRDLGEAAFAARPEPERTALSGSTRSRADVESVREALAAIARTGDLDLSRPHLGTARQAAAVLAARRSLGLAKTTVAAGDPVDLVASELAIAHAALGELTGRDASEAVLDAIFARFCIGK